MVSLLAARTALASGSLNILTASSCHLGTARRICSKVSKVGLLPMGAITSAPLRVRSGMSKILEGRQAVKHTNTRQASEMEAGALYGGRHRVCVCGGGRGGVLAAGRSATMCISSAQQGALLHPWHCGIRSRCRDDAGQQSVLERPPGRDGQMLRLGGLDVEERKCSRRLALPAVSDCVRHMDGAMAGRHLLAPNIRGLDLDSPMHEQRLADAAFCPVRRPEREQSHLSLPNHTIWRAAELT